MRRIQWIGLIVALGLLLLASVGVWSQDSLNAYARSRKPTPTSTLTPSPTPTITPTAPPTPTSTPMPVTGAWQVVTSPAIDVSHSTFGAELNSVAAVSATDVWAVGFGPLPGGPAYVKQTLIEHWDGLSWSIVPSPNPPANFADVELTGVFALAADDVWAVGYYDAPCCIGRFTLIEHWDSTSWSIVSSPNPDPEFNELRAVAGVSSNDVWAVGGSGDNGPGSPPQSLIEHWNGTVWSAVSNPGLNDLFGVTALTATNVWAVAFNSNPNTLADIVEHWDGTMWANISAPNVDDLGNRLNLRAVAAISATDIWAVGDLTDSLNNRYYSVTEHWDGSTWSHIGLGLQDCTLQGVTAPGPSDVWAVDASGLMHTQHWDGVSEGVVSTPDPGIGSGLNGVAAISSGDIWAIGFTENGGPITPLIEQFTQS